MMKDTFNRDEMMQAMQLMHDEAARCIQTSTSEASRKAWYYNQLGVYEFARQIGLITEKERQRRENILRALLQQAAAE